MKEVVLMVHQIKRIILLVVVLIMTACLSGCKKEPTLAEQIRESEKRLEEAREREREAKQKEKELQEAYDFIKWYQENQYK